MERANGLTFALRAALLSLCSASLAALGSNRTVLILSIACAGNKKARMGSGFNSTLRMKQKSSDEEWSERTDSNRRQSRWQREALPLSYARLWSGCIILSAFEKKQGGNYKIPLVERTPWIRSSKVTAWSRALAKALNTTSKT